VPTVKLKTNIVVSFDIEVVAAVYTEKGEKQASVVYVQTDGDDIQHLLSESSIALLEEELLEALEAGDAEVVDEQ
jgi:hypothetical protein